MAKQSPNIAAAFDNLPAPQVPAPEAPRRRGRVPSGEKLVLVGANLPEKYARNIALLHAETGKTKKELMKEALDMLFVAKGGRGLKL